MILHVFNSARASGPEAAFFPVIKRLGADCSVLFLTERRLPEERRRHSLNLARSLGLRTFEVEVQSRFDLTALTRFRAVLKAQQPTILHAHALKATFYTWAAARKLDAPPHLVSTHHGVHVIPDLKYAFFEALLQRFVLPRFDLVLCSNREDREILVRHGVAPQRLQLHPNGLFKTDQLMSPREVAQASWGLPERGIPAEAFVIGIVARLSPEKRHSLALQALSLLRSHRPVHLLCFGEGSCLEALKKTAARSDLSGRVHWMGYRDSLAREMAGFDALLSVSSAEGLPLNLLEAGQAARAVVATAVGGNDDLIEEDSGLLLETNPSPQCIAEAIEKLIAAPELCQKLGRGLQERVLSRFNGELFMRELEGFYAAL